MATQLSDVIKEVREIYQDAVPDFRVSDAELARYTWEAMNTFRRMRPDFRLGTTAPDLGDYNGSSTSVVIPAPFDVDYFSVLVDYVAARAMMRDDQLGDESTALSLFKRAQDALRTPGI